MLFFLRGRRYGPWMLWTVRHNSDEVITSRCVDNR